MEPVIVVCAVGRTEIGVEGILHTFPSEDPLILLLTSYEYLSANQCWWRPHPARSSFRRLYTVSELWGPFTCEEPLCNQPTFSFELTVDENLSLPEVYGPEATGFILKNKLGKARCNEHLSHNLFAP